VVVAVVEIALVVVVVALVVVVGLLADVEYEPRIGYFRHSV